MDSEKAAWPSLWITEFPECSFYSVWSRLLGGGTELVQCMEIGSRVFLLLISRYAVTIEVHSCCDRQKGFWRTWNWKDGVLDGLCIHGFQYWLHITWGTFKEMLTPSLFPRPIKSGSLPSAFGGELLFLFPFFHIFYYSWFTRLCQFLLYSKYMHLYTLFFFALSRNCYFLRATHVFRKCIQGWELWVYMNAGLAKNDPKRNGREKCGELGK